MSAGRTRLVPTIGFIVLTAALTAMLLTGPARSTSDLGSVVAGPARFLVALVVAAIVLTSTHEAAHAVVGRLVGWRVYGVTIGHGPRLLRAQIGQFRLELRGALIGGATIARPTGERRRDVPMLLAGVTVETIVIVATLAWDPSSSWGESARWAILVVACIDIGVNLWPRRLDIGPVTGMATDGAQLMSVIAHPDRWRDDAEAAPRSASHARLVQTVAGGDLDEAITLARTELACDARHEKMRELLGTLLLLDQRWTEALEQLAGRADDPCAEASVANNAAWAAVMTFEERFLTDAERWSAAALTQRPDEPAIANTRGATLVMLDRHTEALPLLRSAASARVSPKQKAFVLAFTALAEHRLGRHAEAGEHLAVARRLDADCPALPEIERRMCVAAGVDAAPVPDPTSVAAQPRPLPPPVAATRAGPPASTA